MDLDAARPQLQPHHPVDFLALGHRHQDGNPRRLPLNPGNIKSSKIKSGGLRKIALTASSPCPAGATTNFSLDK